MAKNLYQRRCLKKVNSMRAGVDKKTWSPVSHLRLAISQRKNHGDRSGRAIITICVLVVLLILTMFFSLSFGATDTSFLAVMAHSFARVTGISIGTELSKHAEIIIFDIRFPRMVLGVLVGAALAVSGAMMQGLFRNPLADPGLVGVSAGAGLSAITVIVLGGTVLAPLVTILGIYLLPLAAFMGSLITTYVLYTIATRRGQTSVATMLLAGIALGALSGALSGILVYMSDDQQLRDLTFWQMGSLGAATWEKIGAVIPFFIITFAAIPFISSGLNAMVLGEIEAKYLGVPIQRLKRIIIFIVACAVGASVAVTGGIGFVGIVVPHLLRLIIGPDHTYLLPSSALLGAILLLLADCVSRTIVAPAELPIGIVTAALGGPFFLWILLRQRSILDL